MNSKTIESSVLASWVLAIYRTIQSYGVNPDSLLEQAGIDKAMLSQHQARIPSVFSDELWHLAVEKTGDPLIGMRVPEYRTINTLYAVDAAAQASSNLREFLRSTCRFSRIVTTAVELSLQDHGDLTELNFAQYGDTPLCDQAVDAFMYVIYSTLQPVLQDIDSNEAFYLEIELTRPALEETAIYTTTFQCPVKFSCSETRIRINPKLLDLPLPSANPDFTRLSEEMLVSYLARIQDQDIEMKVRGAIMELMNTQNLNKNNVAKRMHTSVRNLTRKLSEVDLTFNQLVDSIRQEKAVGLIKQVNISFSEIAFELSFVDVNSFIRAFRRWTGMTPGQYRKSL